MTKELRPPENHRNRLQQVAGHVLRVTNTAHAPWIIIEGTGRRVPTVGRIVCSTR